MALKYDYKKISGKTTIQGHWPTCAKCSKQFPTMHLVGSEYWCSNCAYNDRPEKKDVKKE